MFEEVRYRFVYMYDGDDNDDDNDDDKTPKYPQRCLIQKSNRMGKIPSGGCRLVCSTTSTIIGRSLPEVSMVSV
jgi:hypothetical protein